MEIRGRLREDIMNGNAVLFLGAGVGIDAGLYGAKKLANFLYNETPQVRQFEIYKDDLDQLVAHLDHDPQFTRRWTNERLKNYFLNHANYLNLTNHIQLLENKWKAIFTTNYDLVIEKASDRVAKKDRRLLPISNPQNRTLIFENEPDKLKYFKIHGCIDEIDKNPNNCSPLVITQRDFINSIKRNKVFWDELERYALNYSIIFIGL